MLRPFPSLSNRCPDAVRLTEYLDGGCSPRQARRIARHLEKCERCRCVCADYADDARPDGADRDPAALARLVDTCAALIRRERRARAQRMRQMAMAAAMLLLGCLLGTVATRGYYAAQAARPAAAPSALAQSQDSLRTLVRLQLAGQPELRGKFELAVAHQSNGEFEQSAALYEEIARRLETAPARADNPARAEMVARVILPIQQVECLTKLRRADQARPVLARATAYFRNQAPVCRDECACGICMCLQDVLEECQQLIARKEI